MSSWWQEPVRVSVNGSIAINVTSNERAAELLLHEWPADSPRALQARKAVLRSMESPQDARALATARLAFERAAKDAGVLMPALPKSLAPPGFKAPQWRRKRKG